MNLWPPFLFTGIRVLSIADDWRDVRVTLRLRPWTRNYVGTQYGGHLFSMTAPIWMLMVMHNLGRDYLVWDRSATVAFLAPGREPVYAHLVLKPAAIDALRRASAGVAQVVRGC